MSAADGGGEIAVGPGEIGREEEPHRAAEIGGGVLVEEEGGVRGECVGGVILLEEAEDGEVVAKNADAGLRSPSDQVNGLIYFGRMLDKMRLDAAGKLPEGWQPMRGAALQGTFDARCCRFLQVDYAALEAETLKGDKSDEELLEWAYTHG